MIQPDKSLKSLIKIINQYEQLTAINNVEISRIMPRVH